MDFQLTEEQKLITDTVRRFVREEILPLEQDLDLSWEWQLDLDRKNVSHGTIAPHRRT